MTEQQFKKDFVKSGRLKKFLNDVVHKELMYSFFIESEETQYGFPDMLCVVKGLEPVFIEFKVTGMGGNKVRFQPSQIAFYRRYKNLDIYVVSLVQKTHAVYARSVKGIDEIIDDEARMEVSDDGFYHIT